MNRSALAVLTWFVLVIGAAQAADIPIEGGKMRIEDNVRRRFTFRISKAPQITAATIGDPTVSGGMLEVFGSNAGDGNSGMLVIPPSMWKAVGHPPGSLGYSVHDHEATTGITRLLLYKTNQGGILAINARGPVWGYQINQPQGDISIRLTVGANRFCAKFPFVATQNNPRKLTRKSAPAPPDCN